MIKKPQKPSAPLQCPLCASKDSKDLWVRVKNDYNIFRCSACGVQYVYPQPSPDELEAIYTAVYFERGNKYVRRSADSDPNHINDEAKLKVVSDHIVTGKILDVGCARGGFLAVARSKGFSVTGVEVSADASSYARDKEGLNVFTGELVEVGLPDESFDAVTLWDVIEHLSDPVANLQEMWRLLKPGGVIAISTGDIGSGWAKLAGSCWPLLTPPQHLFYFDRHSMEIALKIAGFELHDFTYPSKTVSVEFLGFKLQEAFGRPFAPVRWLASLPGICNLCVSVNLRDIFTCVAFKPTQ